ncbi:MAG TPA: VWA domain-containing protein [Bryobacteraceae bacterium]|nr:VWA domain-containing protein [Bryobacteraceae bacterium]
MSFRRSLAFLVFGLLIFGLLGLAQQPPATPPAEAPPASTAPAAQSTAGAFVVNSNEVIVPVTVTDEKGRFVSNLDQKDFQILDEGKQQNIRFFTRERNQPVVVGFLLDLSNNSRTQWKNWSASAEEMVEEMLPTDKPEMKGRFSGYLIGYGNEAELMVDTTSDPEPIVEKIRKIKPGGGSALFDAIYDACTNRKLIKGEPVEPRRVIIVIGDGHDNASTHNLEQVLELAQRNLVTIYGISTMSSGFADEGDANLVRLATDTGGRVEYPLNNPYKDVAGFLSTPRDEGNYAIQPGTGGYAAAIASSIYGSVANIVGEVTTQYILRYIPDLGAQDSTRAFRRLNVKVSLPNVKVRARSGYYPFNP